MNLQARLFSTTLMIVGGLQLSQAIAAEPTSQPSTKTAAQAVDGCRQAGADYTKLYTIEETNRAITICQKENKYYYITTAKQSRLVVRYAKADRPPVANERPENQRRQIRFELP